MSIGNSFLKTDFSTGYAPFASSISTLRQLKEDYSDEQFVYLSKNEIEQKGGICLTPCQGGQYEGIVVSNENSKWILHICPGGGYSEFNENEFSTLMPIAAQELSKRDIIPEVFVIDGRHSGNTLENFFKWQNK